MHYKDGTEAKVGDIVRGRGYNLPHDVQGVVLDLKDENVCNIAIATHDGRRAPDEKAIQEYRYHEADAPCRYTEYGEAKNFELVYREGAKK